MASAHQQKGSRSIESAFSWLLQPRLRIPLHVLFWLFFYSDFMLELTAGVLEKGYWLDSYLFQLSVDVTLVYFNLYFLIPRFLLNNRVRAYFGWTFLLLLAGATLSNYAQEYFLYERYFPDEEAAATPTVYLVADYLNSFVFQASVLGTAIGINIFKRYIRERMRLQNLEAENLRTELAFLKAQLNPHALFNALNNIYVLTRKDAAAAQEAVGLLADLLRYQLYDCSQPEVPLAGEIDYIRNYLELERLRKSQAEIDFQVGGEVAGVWVAPLLFLPFVENAVKYGLPAEEAGKVEIRLQAADGLHFQVKNKILKTPKKSVGGLGLENVRRRLALLYPGKHRLEIRQEEGEYLVSLFLDL